MPNDAIARRWKTCLRRTDNTQSNNNKKGATIKRIFNANSTWIHENVRMWLFNRYGSFSITRYIYIDLFPSFMRWIELLSPIAIKRFSRLVWYVYRSTEKSSSPEITTRWFLSTHSTHHESTQHNRAPVDLAFILFSQLLSFFCQLRCFVRNNNINSK